MNVATRRREIDQLRAMLPSAQPDRLTPAQLAERLGLAPDPWQREVLDSDAPRMLLNCSRQSGKSTMTAILALHEALYAPGSLTLLLAPGLRQSSELFRKCLGFYRDLGRPVGADSETALTLTLDNRSRIVSLPSNQSIRGYSSVALLICDEAARIPDELMAAVRPMLAVSGGRFIGLSTPWGRRGWWFEAWHSAEAGERYRIPASECPRIAPAFLEEERRTLGPWFYSQEYENVFADTLDQVFGHELIARAVTAEVLPLFGSAA